MATNSNPNQWWVFRGNGNEPTEDIERRLKGVTPLWRKFDNQQNRENYRGNSFVFDPQEDKRTLDLINAALYLHRPMLIKGDTGIGKSSLAYAIAKELGIKDILYWPITSHTSIRDGLYRYDIIRHLQSLDTEPKRDTKEDDAGRHFSLKQLGSALASEKRRVLLIDELDKSDMDLPNDLLHVLEEGKFQIDELVYQTHHTEKANKPGIEVLADNGETVRVEKGGWIYCKSFPIIIITSNLEREFPPAFMRRCITIELTKPTETKLYEIVKRHFSEDKMSGEVEEHIKSYIQKFRGAEKHLATDRLLNAVHLYIHTKETPGESLEKIIEDILLDQESKEK